MQGGMTVKSPSATRSRLTLVALAVAVLLMLTLTVIPATATTRVTLVSEYGTHTEAWKTEMDAFEKQSGIDLELTQIPYANYFDQLTLNFTGNVGNYDVVYISGLWYPAFANAGYIAPLDDLSDSINVSDIPGIENAYQKGKLYIIPYMNELGGIVYRKDLFDDPDEKAAFKKKYGYELQPPRTLKQYQDIAEFFNRPPKLYGVTLMGRRSIFLATHFMNRLWAHGGQLLDSNMRPAFNSPAGVQALKEAREMFKYANPAAKNYDFQEAVTEFTMGRSAMAELWTTSLLYADDPAKSKIVGKASFVGFPRPDENLGKKLPMLYISWGFAIAQSAKDKDAAKEWVKYVTSKDAEVRAAVHGNIPARYSSLGDPKLQAKFPWLKAFKEAMEQGIPTPMVPLIPEGSALVNQYLVPAVATFMTDANADAKKVLDEAANGVTELMRAGGYYK